MFVENFEKVLPEVVCLLCIKFVIVSRNYRHYLSAENTNYDEIGRHYSHYLSAENTNYEEIGRHYSHYLSAEISIYHDTGRNNSHYLSAENPTMTSFYSKECFSYALVTQDKNQCGQMTG